MSSLLVHGYFNLSGGSRSASAKPGGGGTIWHSYYGSVIQCPKDQFIHVQFRMYSPQTESIHPNGTVAHVTGRVHFQPDDIALIDPFRISTVPGDPTEEGYELRVPNVLYPEFTVLGTVTSGFELTEDGGKRFRVICSEYVRDSRRVSTVYCLFVSGARWANTPVPPVQSNIQVFGHAAAVAQDGILVIQVEHIVLNAGVNAAAPPGGGGPSSSAPFTPSKRRRFAGSCDVSPAGPSRVSTSFAGNQHGSPNVPPPPIAGPSRSPPRDLSPLTPELSASVIADAEASGAQPANNSAEPNAAGVVDAELALPPPALPTPAHTHAAVPSSRAKGKRVARR